MPDLLLELFCEEIPARMQQRAAEDLKARITNALVDLGLVYEGAVAHVTPRRLCLHIAGLPARSNNVLEEKKGPRVGAPEAAVQGFLKSAGLTLLAQAQVQSDGKKGEFYIAKINRPGRDTKDILAEIIVKTVRDFPWPKSMRWGAASRSSSSLRFVRPLHSIICAFGTETETPEIVEFDIDGIQASDLTFGHRFMATGPVQARRFDDYVAALENSFVILDRERRKDIIRSDAKNLAFAQGLELVEDEALLDEVAGLVEWPVVLMGTFDASFLEVPDPVIRTTIRANQKCFVLRGANGKLTNKFIITANIAASDGGKEIIRGNERVVAARLSDAKFFFEQDRRAKLLNRLPKLDKITFHERLGTQGERVQRIAVLAKEIAPLVGAKPEEAELAAKLAKADLVTEMVGEFPELQGFMGRTYARLEGVPENIAAAIEEHYKPLGPSDVVPSNPVSIAVALADKLDMLVGFWAIDEKPTGSKDPFALRRAALGVIRIFQSAKMSIPLQETFSRHAEIVNGDCIAILMENEREIGRDQYKNVEKKWKEMMLEAAKAGKARLTIHANIFSETQRGDLILFLNDRLRTQLREQGLRHDVIEAVLALEGQDDLLLIVKRTEALDAFLKTDNGKALQAGVTRALNILKIEEKKDDKSYDGNNAGKLVAAEEAALSKAIDEAEKASTEALTKEDFTGAMTAIAALRTPIDAFFDKVMVNEEPHRAGRLQLLARIRALTSQIADFSKLEG